MLSVDSLAAIRERVAADFEATIRDENGQSIDAHTPGTGYTEEAKVIAGVAYMLQLRQVWIAKQVNNKEADDSTIVQRAAEKGIPQIAPSFSAGTYSFTGTDGLSVASELVLQHSNGQQFRTTSEAVIVGGIASVGLTAMEPGVAGNIAAGTSLTLIQPISGIDSNGTVDAPGLTAGAAIEPFSRVRERVIEFDQKPALGGKDDDYIAWAKAAHVDVSRAFVFPHENGIGSIVVRFVTEDLDDPIPTPATVSAVHDHILTQKPTGTRSYTTEACIANPLNLVFTAIDPATDAVKSAIEAEVKDLIRRRGKPAGTLKLSEIRAAISSATGEEDFSITLNADFVSDETQIPTWGVPTWPGV